MSSISFVISVNFLPKFCVFKCVPLHIPACVCVCVCLDVYAMKAVPVHTRKAYGTMAA
jgi:hypothetical protein